MAINRIVAPLATSPATFATPVVNQLASNILDHELPERIIGTNVVDGARFNIGGVEYVADADTAITGTASDYVKITPSGATASAAYVADLTGVTWNPSYKGYYDTTGNLYVFDELKAMGAGAITSTMKEYIGAKNLGTGWHAELSKPLACVNTHNVVSLGAVNASYPAYTKTSANVVKNAVDLTGNAWTNLFSITYTSNGTAFNLSKITGTYHIISHDADSYLSIWDVSGAAQVGDVFYETTGLINFSVPCDFDIGLNGIESKTFYLRRYEYGASANRGPFDLTMTGSYCDGITPGIIQAIANVGQPISVAAL